MLKDKFINVEIKRQNVNHYKDKGYDCKVGDIIEININDLPAGSKIKVIAICDYCGKEKEVSYCHYIQSISGIIHKYPCGHCKGLKIKESNLIIYGVDSVMKLEENKTKLQETIMNKYGVKVPAKSNIVKSKMRQTCLNKYGVCNPMFLNSSKLKIRKTNMERYGVESPLQNDNVKNKHKETCLNRYGVDNPMKIKEVQEKVMSEGNKTKHINGTISTSRQQAYISKLVNGELNYPVGIYCLDIAFPDDKLYIEYNGSGHDISIRTKNISKAEFNKKDEKRYKYIKSLGWKEILIKSSKDYLIRDDYFKAIINNYLYELKSSDLYQKIIDIDSFDKSKLYKMKSSTSAN